MRCGKKKIRAWGPYLPGPNWSVLRDVEGVEPGEPWGIVIDVLHREEDGGGGREPRGPGVQGLQPQQVLVVRLPVQLMVATDESGVGVHAEKPGVRVLLVMAQPVSHLTIVTSVLVVSIHVLKLFLESSFYCHTLEKFKQNAKKLNFNCDLSDGVLCFAHQMRCL